MSDEKTRLLRHSQSLLAYMAGYADAISEKHNPMLDGVWNLISKIEGIGGEGDEKSN